MHNSRIHFPISELVSLSRMAAVGTDMKMNQTSIILTKGV